MVEQLKREKKKKHFNATIMIYASTAHKCKGKKKKKTKEKERETRKELNEKGWKNGSRPIPHVISSCVQSHQYAL